MRNPSVKILALAGVVLLASCGKKQGPDAAPPDAGPMLIGPESRAVVKRDVVATGPRIAGSLQPQRLAQLRAEVGGSVTSVDVELGEPVKNKQLLARIEAIALRDAFQSAQSSLRSAESDLSLAKRTVERTRKLVEAGALAENNLETSESAAAAAEARVFDARARVAQAKQQVDASLITAPFDGVISQREVSVGDVVAPGTTLFTVIDPSSMRLEASVPSEELGQIAVDAPVRFQVRGYPGQTFTGKIDRIAPAADPVTRQIPILVSLPNPGGKLVAGLFAEGRIASSSKETLVIPANALEEIAGKAHVLRHRNGAGERVAVEVGVRDDRTEQVEILSGLEVGDVVLVGGARKITPGSPIRLTEPDRSGAPAAAAGSTLAPSAAAK